MDRESILAELKNRGANVNSLEPTNQQPNFDREQILEVLKERGIDQTKSGEFLPTAKQQDFMLQEWEVLELGVLVVHLFHKHLIQLLILRMIFLKLHQIYLKIC